MLRVFLGIDPETGKRVYHNETFHGNKKAAAERLAKTVTERSKGHLTAGGGKRIMSELFDDLLFDYRTNDRSIEWAEIVVEKHLRPFLGKLPISKLTSDHIQRYIVHRRAQGVCNGTINREFTLLRHSLNMGRDKTPPKVTRAPKIPRLEEAPPRKGFFEADDYRKLKGELPEEIRPVLTFAYCTGCRRGEILALEWTQVDLLERIIRLEPGTTKNDEGRSIPLAPELYETLKMQRAIRDERFPDCPWVFFRYDSGEHIRDFRDAWEYACERAGLWIGDRDTGKPTKLFHDLRRTGVRNLIRAGVPEAVAMKISGHKTRSMLDRYNIVSESDLKDAARRLGEYMARKNEPESDPHTIRTHPKKQASGRDALKASKLLN